MHSCLIFVTLALILGSWKDGLPEYSEEDVRKHNSKQNRLWVTYKNGVYDITDFVAMHPGGDKILLASGASLEPFWSMYQQHRTGFVVNILEELRVGNILLQG
jgi:sulfite oxidase